jgi:hypothetical protein
MDSNTRDFYEPDSTWEIFGAISPELFVEKFVIHPKFHFDVHEDVLKSYNIAEHTMALCYYHYPMYELALDKLLRIFEMAVNLRCEELGIEKSFLDKKQRRHTKKLSRLIDELIQINMVPEFGSVMHNIRKIRNFSAHQERYSNLGIIAGQVIYPILNLINLMFIGKDYHLENRSHFESTKQHLRNIRNDLFIIENEGLKILVYDPDLLDCYKKGNDWIYSLSFMPVLSNSEEKIKNHQSPNRIMRFFRNLIIDNVSIQGFELLKKREELIEKTLKPENNIKLRLQLDAIKKADQTDAFIFNNSSKLNADRKTQEFIYETRWL